MMPCHGDVFVDISRTIQPTCLGWIVHSNNKRASVEAHKYLLLWKNSICLIIDE